MNIKTSFRTKFILVAGCGVLAGLLLSGAVALNNFMTLGDTASNRIEKGLSAASNEYLQNYIQTTSVRTMLMLNHAFSDLRILGDFLQFLTDHPKDADQIGESLSKVPALEDHLSYHDQGNWFQNPPSEPTVVSVWGHLLDQDHRILPEVQKQIRDTEILDLLLPALYQKGANKLYMYYVGPRGGSFIRLAPYVDMASEFDRMYPGHNDADFWDFFFPGLWESWEHLSATNIPEDQLRSTLTLTPPYEDAAGGGIIMSAFNPVWDAQRKITGVAGMDFSITNIVDMIKDVRIAQTGFAFLAQSSGNVLAINDFGEKLLGLSLKTEANSSEAGISLLNRNLHQSTQKGLAGLKLPTTDGAQQAVSVTLTNVGGQTRRYTILMRRLPPISAWEKDAGLLDEHWILGFVVAEDEIYGPLFAAQGDIRRSMTSTLVSQVSVGLASLVVVLLGILIVARRVTSGLTALSSAARKIKDKDYSVRVNIESRDEIGQLGNSFNSMASEIETYTENLEELVRERTLDLEAANEEISTLNTLLTAENVRLCSEIEVARQLQMMVLPKAEELVAARKMGLQVAGFMEPADEVGGDYYDVLPSGSGVKIGVGDVTGHGLESGVLMIMVQTITRTLQEVGVDDPAKFLSILNAVLYKNIQRIGTDKNLTLFFADYAGDNEFVFSGQHEEVIVVHGDGTVERINTMDLGFMVGLEPDISPFVNTCRLKLTNGDVVVFYTDGVTEADNPNQEQFGLDRLCASAVRWRHLSSEEIKQHIIEDLMAFIGDSKIYDDITLLVTKLA